MLVWPVKKPSEELCVKIIAANSPEARGRIENLFIILQDRLVKELRLRQISNKDDANKFLKEEFLPKFNQRFTKESKSKTNLHRPLTETDDLNAILSIQSERLVNNDFTIRFKCKWYQLEKTQPTLVTPKTKIIIEERLDQTIRVRLKSKYLTFHKIPKPVKEQCPETFALTSNGWCRGIPRNARTPKPNHPWKRLRPTLTKH